jgi:Peptidase family S41/N-terminal domain of Peptidase_S41 in eukaryotic IRBP
MDQAEIAAVMGRITGLVEEHYVFPGVGTDLARILRSRMAEGRYAGAVEAELAALVTEDLQSVNGDRHLRLLYSHDEVPDESDPASESAALARWATRAFGGVARVERLDGNVGFVGLRPVLFPPAIAGQAVAAAMSLVAPADALLLDVRRCLGGDPAAVALVCSYLFGSEPVHLNDLVERKGGRVSQSWTLPYVPGPRFGPDKPVYVLTSATTFSGGEELAYDLQQLGRATIVGERSGGGAHPREGFRVHAHLQATIPVARAVNPVSETNWEGTGVVPDVAVPADQAFAAACRLALTQVLGLGESADRRETALEAREALDRLARPAAT